MSSRTESYDTPTKMSTASANAFRNSPAPADATDTRRRQSKRDEVGILLARALTHVHQYTDDSSVH